MAVISDDLGQFFCELLDNRGLSLGGAAIHTRGAVSGAYLGQLRKGYRPSRETLDRIAPYFSEADWDRAYRLAGYVPPGDTDYLATVERFNERVEAIARARNIPQADVLDTLLREEEERFRK